MSIKRNANRMVNFTQSINEFHYLPSYSQWFLPMIIPPPAKKKVACGGRQIPINQSITQAINIWDSKLYPINHHRRAEEYQRKSCPTVSADVRNYSEEAPLTDAKTVIRYRFFEWTKQDENSRAILLLTAMWRSVMRVAGPHHFNTTSKKSLRDLT